MHKLPANIMQCYVLHFIFRNVQTIANIMESQITINEKKLPSWVEKPVQDMLDDIFLDLGHALLPVMYLVKNEYIARPDRLKLISFVEKKLKESEAKVDLKCHCAGCVDYEKITANGTRVHLRKGKPKGRPRTKPFQKLMEKRLTKKEIDEIEKEARKEAEELRS